MPDTTQLTITLHPIKTAPKDGEPFFVVRKFDSAIVAIQWDTKLEHFVFPPVGHYDIIESEDELADWYTHWFRLPDRLQEGSQTTTEE